MSKMNELWYWKLGFSANPFSIKPAALTSEVAGRQMQPILEKVESGSVQFIEAPLGSGKTTILKGVISRFKGKKKLIYCSCINGERLGIKELLKNATIKGRLFGEISNGMILLIDEAQNIMLEDSQAISALMASGNIKSVAFFGIDYDKSLLTDELNNSLNGNVTVLSTLSQEDAVALVRHRIGNLKLVPDYVIREVYARSNCNPRHFLQNFEELCRKAVELSIQELTVTDVAHLLKSPELAALLRKRQKKLPSAKEETKEKAEKPKKAKKEEKPKQEKPMRKTAANRTRKERATEAKARESVSSTEPQTATVTYSGYNLKNIRTYEQEMGTVKPIPREELDEPEEE